MSDTLGRSLLLFGPAVVLAAGLLLMLAAIIKGGVIRRVGLITLPFLIVGGEFLIMLVGSGLTSEGSGALVGGVVLGLSMIGASFYYPALGVWAMVLWVRDKRKVS